MRGLQPGPINTFPKWKDLGRFVKRGERALTLCMPITCNRREEASDEEHTFTGFVYKARWFVLGQTDGQELEPITIPQWDAQRALTALRIQAKNGKFRVFELDMEGSNCHRNLPPTV